MYPKVCLISLLLLFVFNDARALERYREGDSLYVWALSGLVLRSGPAAEATRLLTIPYGEFVVALRTKYSGDETKHQVRIQQKEFQYYYAGDSVFFPEVNLSGAWARVVYKGQEGFVFDGYLSHWPVLQVQYEDYSDAPGGKLPRAEPLRNYLDRNFGRVDTLLCVHGDAAFPDERQERAVYKRGIVVESRAFEKHGEQVWVFPDMSRDEAFLLMNVYLHLEYALSTKKEMDKERIYTWNGDDFSIGSMNAGCGTTVKIFGRICIFYTECSC